MKEIASQLATIVGSSGVQEWEEAEVLLQKRIISAVASATPSCIVYPQTQAQLAEVIACASHHNWRILVCGSGSKLGWGGLGAGIQLVVSTTRLNQVIQHAVGDLTVTMEAGARFGAIQETLAKAGQFIALDPSAPTEATLGGIVATADTGSLRQRYGGVRDQVLGISFVRADGKVAKAGGRVVKNVAGYDLMKLMTGSYGTLGAIAQVTFRVFPLPPTSETVVLSGGAEAINQAVGILRAGTLTPIAADLLSRQLMESFGVRKELGLIVRFWSLPESVTEQSRRLLELGQQLGLEGRVYQGDEETGLWQQLGKASSEATVVAKFGVIPTQAVALLSQLDLGLVHIGSGLGWLWGNEEQELEAKIQQWRSLCETQGGFLTLLVAPVRVKQELDVWGYAGNALDVMRRIKEQFDPGRILSPCRFVGGI